MTQQPHLQRIRLGKKYNIENKTLRWEKSKVVSHVTQYYQLRNNRLFILSPSQMSTAVLLPHIKPFEIVLSF
jgi:hypothetical protein